MCDHHPHFTGEETGACRDHTTGPGAPSEKEAVYCCEVWPGKTQEAGGMSPGSALWLGPVSAHGSSSHRHQRWQRAQQRKRVELLRGRALERASVVNCCCVTNDTQNVVAESNSNRFLCLMVSVGQEFGRYSRVASPLSLEVGGEPSEDIHSNVGPAAAQNALYSLPHSVWSQGCLEEMTPTKRNMFYVRESLFWRT